jgi:hypothetical protein
MPHNTPPIPAPSIEKSIFQTTFWNQFALSSLIGLIFGLPLFFAVEKRAFETKVLVFSIANGLVFGAIITAINIMITPVVTHPDQLEGRTFWGSRVLVAWSEIESVQPTRFFWLRYLKIFSPGTKHVIWLPLFLSDRDGFRAVLEKYAEPENPLRRAFAEYS